MSFFHFGKVCLRVFFIVIIVTPHNEVMKGVKIKILIHFFPSPRNQNAYEMKSYFFVECLTKGSELNLNLWGETARLAFGMSRWPDEGIQVKGL